jgi:hypothetical protein
VEANALEASGLEARGETAEGGSCTGEDAVAGGSVVAVAVDKKPVSVELRADGVSSAADGFSPLPPASGE